MNPVRASVKSAVNESSNGMKNNAVVILAGQGESTNIIYNSLKGACYIKSVIIEDPEPKIHFMKRRIKKLGFFNVFGQILFRMITIPLLNRASRKRAAELKRIFKLNDAPIDEAKIIRVESVNSDDTIDILKKSAPDIVVINGTRIVSKSILECTPAKFVNMHAGITPLYRGVHGAYWALSEGNKQACGVTVHFVDAGIDTGNILGQETIVAAEYDNFVTYPDRRRRASPEKSDKGYI
jgi:hypothetical protein